MKGHGTKFGRKKEEAIVALLTTRTTEEAAAKIDYFAYTRAVNRDDSRYREATDWFQAQIAAKSRTGSESAQTVTSRKYRRASAR